MEVRIGLVAPYEGMITIANELAKRRGVALLARTALLEDAAEAARDMESQGVDVIIVREGTEVCLRDVLKIPIVPIRMSGMDILRAVLKAREISKKVALAQFPRMHRDIDVIRKAAGCDLTIFEFVRKEEARHKIENLRGQIGVFVGGGLTAKMAEALGLKSVLIETSTHWISDAVDLACDIAIARWEERSKREQIATIIDLVPSGILAVDEQRRFSVCNKAAERILGTNRDKLLGNRDDQILEKVGLAEALRQRETVQKPVLGRRGSFFCQSVPIVIAKRVCGGVAVLDSTARIESIERTIRVKRHLETDKPKYSFNDILYASSIMAEVVKAAKKMAATDFNILITGETGTGKELFAHSIANYSPRKNGPFVAINCAAIPPTLLEAELFGYEEGAFTGARRGGKIGYFELAHGGTIFLDEVGALPLELQTRLLRVIQEKEVIRVGGRSIIPIDVRIIAATNAPLLDMVSRGTFREDLYYRLAVLRLHLPPLRERKEDIPVIARHVLKQYGVDKKAMEAILSALEHFTDYAWRGNVRELVNILAQLVALLPQGEVIKTPEVSHILRRLLCDRGPTVHKLGDKDEHEFLDGTDQIRSLATVFKDIEERVLKELLREKGLSKVQIARLLGISRTTLWRRRKKWQGPGDEASFEGSSRS